MCLKLFIKSFKEFRNVQKRKETSSLPLRSPNRLQLYQNTAFRRPSTVSIMNIFSPTTTFSAQMSEIGPASSLSQIPVPAYLFTSNIKRDRWLIRSSSLSASSHSAIPLWLHHEFISLDTSWFGGGLQCVLWNTLIDISPNLLQLVWNLKNHQGPAAIDYWKPLQGLSPIL